MKTSALALFAAVITTQAADCQLHSFERIQLTDRYYSEGINAADVDGDGAELLLCMFCHNFMSLL